MGKEGHIGVVKSAVTPIQPMLKSMPSEYNPGVEVPMTQSSNRSKSNAPH